MPSRAGGNSRLPSVTSDIPRDLRMFVDRVRETLVTEGRVREIVRSTSGPGNPGPSPGPGPDGPVDPPTTPTGLRATGEPGAILVQWDIAPYRGHSHTEVWASATDDFDQAVAVGMAPGPMYLDVVGPLVGRWYWVRFVNRNGVAGPFNARNGTFGESLEPYKLPEPPIQELDDSVLTKLLDERLKWLEDPTFGLRGEAARIRGEFNELLDTTIEGIYFDLGELQQALDDALVTELFDETKTYALDDLVIWRNPDTGTSFIYQCKQAFTPPPTRLPSDTAYWNQVGDSASIAAIADDIASAGLSLQARGLYDGNGEVIGAIAAALLAVRSRFERSDGSLVEAGAILGLITSVGELESLAGALLTAEVVQTGVDSNGNTVYTATQSFLGLRARVESQTSNLLANSEWMQDDAASVGTTPEGWAKVDPIGFTSVVGTNFSERTTPFSSDGVRALFVRSDFALESGKFVDIVQYRVPVKAEQRYQASVYVGSHNASGRVQVNVVFRTEHDENVGATTFGTITTLTKSGRDDLVPYMGTTLDDYQRLSVFTEPAPEGAAFARVIFRIHAGAVAPLAVYMTRPLFGAAVAGQTVPSLWVPGVASNAFQAAASAVLAADAVYRGADGFASAQAFLALQSTVNNGPNSLSATSAAAFGAKDVVTKEDGTFLAAHALDALQTEVLSGPNNLISLSSRISGVASSLGNNNGNLINDVGFSKIGVTEPPEKVIWTRVLNGGWDGATFGADMVGNTLGVRVPEAVAFIRRATINPASGFADIRQDIPIRAGQWYQFSCWLRSIRCTARLVLTFHIDSSTPTPLKDAVFIDLVETAGPGTSLSGYTRRHLADLAPATATIARITFRALNSTDVDPMIFAVRPYFAEAVANQSEPSPWLPPIADAFTFQEFKSEVTDGPDGLVALGGLISGVDTKIEDAVSGAFSSLSSSISIVYENRVTFSEDFANWGRTFASVFPDVAGVPGFSGTTENPLTPADFVAEVAQSGNHGVFMGLIPVEAGYFHTVSIYAKAVGTRHLAFRVLGQNEAGSSVAATISFWSFNLTSGAFIGSSGDLEERSGSVESLGEGWYRCSATFRAPKNNVVKNVQLVCYIATSAINYTAPPSYLGSTAAGLQLFGAQVNAGLRPDNYRRTQAEALFGPIHDRVRAVSSAITAVDSQLTAADGTPFTANAFAQLQSYAGEDGTLATMVNGLQAGVGKGGNHVPNSSFGSNSYGWSFASVPNNPTYTLSDAAITEPTWAVGGDPLPVTGVIRYLVNTLTTGYAEVRTRPFPVIAGRHYELSAYMGAHRCIGTVVVYWLGPTGANVGANMTPPVTQAHVNGPAGGRAQLSSFHRAFGVFQAPAGASTAFFAIRSSAMSTAQVNSYLFFVQPFMGLAAQGQSTPSEYAPGLDPDIFASLKQEGVVWADPTGEGSAGARYTLRLRASDNTGEAQVGFGMAAIKENGVWVADVRFNANRFAIMNPSHHAQGPRYPFLVADGAVWMNTAIIREASIGNAMIDTLSANKLTAGTLRVGTGITSQNWSPGVSGWGIDASGYAEFGSAVIRGQLTAGKIVDLSLGPQQLAHNSATRIQRFSNTSFSGQSGTQQFNNLLYLAQNGNPFDRTQEAIIFFAIDSGAATGGGVYLYNTHGALMWQGALPVAAGFPVTWMAAYAPNDSGPGNYIVEIRNKFPASAIVTVTSTVIMSKR